MARHPLNWAWDLPSQVIGPTRGVLAPHAVAVTYTCGHQAYVVCSGKDVARIKALHEVGRCEDCLNRR